MYKKLFILVSTLGFAHGAGADANNVAKQLSELSFLDVQLGAAITKTCYNEDKSIKCIGDYEQVKELVENGANVNAEVEGLTPLMLASMLSTSPEFCDSIITFLLSHGAVAHKGILVETAGFGNVNSVRALLDAGVDINERYDRDYTALMNASHMGRTAVVACLLQRGADRTLKTDFGKTAYDLAANDEIRALLKV